VSTGCNAMLDRANQYWEFDTLLANILVFIDCRTEFRTRSKMLISSVYITSVMLNSTR